MTDSCSGLHLSVVFQLYSCMSRYSLQKNLLVSHWPVQRVLLVSHWPGTGSSFSPGQPRQLCIVDARFLAALSLVLLCIMTFLFLLFIRY